MTQLPLSNPSKLKRLTVAALAVWLMGFNYLFCCGQWAAAAEPKEESCSTRMEYASDGDSCCSKNTGKRRVPKSAPCGDDCCILSAPLGEFPSVPLIHQILAAPDHPPLPSPMAEAACQGGFPIHQSRFLDRSGTFLRCCVFLI